MHKTYKHKEPMKAVIKMHTLIIKATSFHVRSEYIGIIMSLK